MRSRVVRGVLVPALAVASSFARPTDSAGQTTLVRRDVSTLTTTQVAALRRGVAAMKARPATNPTSWTYQANMHGTDDTPLKPAWNTCQHGTYLFLAWHQMYLYYFERILRQASGDASLTLPYWNYSCGCSRSLPAIFRSPAAPTNPLYVSQRAPGINAGAQLPPSAIAYVASLGPTVFVSPVGSGAGFGGQRATAAAHFAGPHGRLENQPHDVIHVVVGGATGWMSDPNMAARDPIFYLHHANIDRLWKRWLDLAGGRQNPPTTDTVWSNTPFTFFDENGAQVQMTGQEVLDTVGQLRYRYDDDPGITALAGAAGAEPSTALQPPTPAEVLGSSPASGSVELGAARLEVAVPIVAGGANRITSALARPRNTVLLLNLEGIEYDKNPGVYYEVYINLPKDVREPDPQSPNYVGNLALFGLKAHDASETPARMNFDVTAQVQALKAAGQWKDDTIDVTFYPQGSTSAGARGRSAALAVPNKAKISKITLSSAPAE